MMDIAVPNYDNNSLPSPLPTSGRKGIEVLKSAVRRLTSRAALIRQSSAALLRHDATPSVLRKTSAINLFPELDDIAQGPGIRLYYYSGWLSPSLHFISDQNKCWTSPPGAKFTKCTFEEKRQANLPVFEGISLDKECIWMIVVLGVSSIECVPNQDSKFWDKCPGGGNYVIQQPGDYYLRNGRLNQLIDPPKKPSLLKAVEVGITHVTLSWNPPVIETELVAGYQVYRDESFIASLGENVKTYVDKGLLGLTRYKYFTKAVNELGVTGESSDTVTVITGEPGKPSAPQNLRILSYSKKCISFQWEPPADNGGSIIRSYQMFRNGCFHTSIKATQNSKFEQWSDDKNIIEGAWYIYHISSVNIKPPPMMELVPPTLQLMPKYELSETPMGDTPSSSAGSPQVDQMSPRKRRTFYMKEACKHQRPSDGALSDGVEVYATTMRVLPTLNDGRCHIILQGFNWRSSKNAKGWYNVLMSKIDLIKSCSVTMLWCPPPAKSVSPDGYMPTKWYELNSKYGSQQELIDLCTKLKDVEISPALDLVINHRCGSKQDGKGQWTVFENPDWENWAIVNNNVQGYDASGSRDTGTQSECAPDIDHTNRRVREDVKKWISWLFNEIGFAAIRIDMAPGYSVDYQVEYIEHVGTPFAFGEYWNGEPRALHNYTNGGRGRIAALDFALYYILRRCVENNNFAELSNHGQLHGLVGKDPQRAVTFIDNHDTEHLNFVGLFARGKDDLVLQGYVFILTHPGTPCIYWNHFSDYGDFFRSRLCTLASIRKDHGITSHSGVYIDKAQWGLYASYISRNRHCNKGGGSVAMKIGSTDWKPEGGGWSMKINGKGFAVWAK